MSYPPFMCWIVRYICQQD